LKQLSLPTKGYLVSVLCGRQCYLGKFINTRNKTGEDITFGTRQMTTITGRFISYFVKVLFSFGRKVYLMLCIFIFYTSLYDDFLIIGPNPNLVLVSVSWCEFKSLIL